MDSQILIGMLLLLALGLFAFSIIKRLVRLALFVGLILVLLYAFNAGLIPRFW
ncbi:hypothetical protein ACP3TJ_02415 [Desulforudis sp. 1088]|uniref:hypothetical protein n=1 Tax=unclassified Candidatus Desulforudis TaxID=2635950 RepID=UPI00347A16B1